MISLEYEILKTPDGLFEWKSLNKIWMLAIDRLTFHDIYYRFEFSSGDTILFEEQDGVSELINKHVLSLPGIDVTLFSKIWKAEVMAGDHLIYAKVD